MRVVPHVKWLEYNNSSLAEKTYYSKQYSFSGLLPRIPVTTTLPQDNIIGQVPDLSNYSQLTALLHTNTQMHCLARSYHVRRVCVRDRQSRHRREHAQPVARAASAHVVVDTATYLLFADLQRVQLAHVIREYSVGTINVIK